MSKWLEKIDPMTLEELIKLRQDLHRYPELSSQEHRTARTVAKYLIDTRLQIVTEGITGTGVVGLLNGEHPGPCLALRADIDALPIQEKTGLAYASVNPGVMHACGHDGHTAILLGTARVLAGLRSELYGSIKFVFQPAEENGNGAQKMIAAGVLTDFPKADAVLALHARPQIGVGQIELDPLPAAATQSFEIKVLGRSIHAAYPHQGTDPIVIASQIVTALQQIVSRQVAPFQAAVLTIGTFHSGSAHNIIPAEALLTGTIRTRDPEVEKKVIESVKKIAEGVALALGGSCQVSFKEGSPRVRNDPQLMELVRRVGVEILKPENVLDSSEPTMGGEDFGFYTEEQGGVPGCLFRLGIECNDPVHTPNFDFGQQAVEPGILMMTNIALQFCNQRKKV